MEYSLNSCEYVEIDGKRFDVLKFVLALFIIGIHTKLSIILMPVFRLAVPLFFIMTSYFFFLKQKGLSTQEQKKEALLHYSKRILKLYFFWFVLLLPITVYYRKWYVDISINTIIEMVQCFIFSSTFMASWFLMACLLSVIIVWFLSQRLKIGVLAAVGIVLYSFCCLTSNYYHLCVEYPCFYHAYQHYVSLFCYPYNSFLDAFIFVVIGKYLAEHQVWIPRITLFIIVLLSFFFLYLEYYVVSLHQWSVADDSYFSLMPLSVGLFMFIGQNYVNVQPDTSVLRKYSTIIYCLHCSLVPKVYGAWKHLRACFGFIPDASASIFAFVLTLLICLLISKLLLSLEQKQSLRFLRYSH